MEELLQEGDRIAPFTLPIAGGTETVTWKDLAHDRNVVVLLVSNREPFRDVEIAWLQEAREQIAEINRRRLTVLVIAKAPEKIAALQDLPVPAFQVLHDGYGEETCRLGGAPAVYLVGRDGRIRSAARGLPPLAGLLRYIDAADHTAHPTAAR